MFIFFYEKCSKNISLMQFYRYINNTCYILKNLPRLLLGCKATLSATAVGHMKTGFPLWFHFTKANVKHDIVCKSFSKMQSHPLTKLQ